MSSCTQGRKKLSAMRATDEATAWTVAAYSSRAVPEIGLFPLELVLLPTERVPLHIFEDRYKELIGDCLAHDGRFGLVFADERGLREIGTLAAVAEVLERFSDGRLNILVEGRERFKLLELTKGR